MTSSISFLTYFLLFTSLISHIGIGNLLIKSSNIITQSLLGILFTASITSILTWTFPLYIKPFLLFGIILGFVISTGLIHLLGILLGVIRNKGNVRVQATLRVVFHEKPLSMSGK